MNGKYRLEILNASIFYGFGAFIELIFTEIVEIIREIYELFFNFRKTMIQRKPF